MAFEVRLWNPILVVNGLLSLISLRFFLCYVPGHWGGNLIRDPPGAAELSLLVDDFEQSFLDGQPFEFTGVKCEFAS